MGEVSSGGGFEWWAPHDRALRRARVLLVLGAVVVASYLVVPLVCAVVVIRGGVDALSTRDAALLVVGSLAILAAVAGVIALAASRAPTRRVREWSGARPASRDEEHRLAATIEPFAIARGMARPSVWVTADDAPNALAFGRAGSPNVCLTRGALALPPQELAALCAYEMTALTCSQYTACIAAIDVALFAESCLKLLWMAPWLLLLSTVVGVSPLLAAVVALCFAAAVATTRLLLLVADRALPTLLDDAAELVDLETVRVTALPGALADLLTRIADGDRRVSTTWQVAHRWFDRRERDRTASTGGWIGAPALASRCGHGSAAGLRARAAVAARQSGAPVAIAPPRRRRKHRGVLSRGA